MFYFRDLFSALYALRKAKSYALTVIVILGLTLGTLVSVLNLGYQVLLAPLPYPDPGQLHYLHGNILSKNGQRTPALPIAAAEAGYALKPEGSNEAALLGYNQGVAKNLIKASTLQLGYVTPEFFRLVAMPMALGRAFSPEEGLHSQAAVAVLSYRSWVRLFAQDPKVLGQRLQIGQQWFQIVGVSAAGFQEPEVLSVGQQTDVWLPWDRVQVALSDRQQWGRLWGKHAMLVKISAPADASRVRQAYHTDFNSRFEAASEKPAELVGAIIDTQLTPLTTQVQHQARRQYGLLLLGTLLLTALGLINLAQFVSARLTAYQSQLAIRAAIGARPMALLQLLLLEWSILLLLSCGASLFVQFMLLEAFRSLPTGLLPRVNEMTFNSYSLLLYLLLPLLITLGLFWRLRRQVDYSQLQRGLTNSNKGSRRQISKKQIWRFLTVQGLVVTIILVFSMQLLVQALNQLWQAPGVNTADRYHASLDLAALDEIARPQRRTELYRIRDLLEKQAGIQQVSIANLLPLANYGDYQWHTELRTQLNEQQVFSASSSLIDEHYLQVLATPILRGRNFNADEVRQQLPVILINQTFASLLQRGSTDQQLPALYWANDETNRPYEIVGVFADWNLPGMTEPPRALFATRFEGLPSLIIQTAAGITLSQSALNQQLATVDPRYQITELHSLAENHDKRLILDRLIAVSTASLALVILLISTAGLFGLLSYSVQLRRFEFGVRMAMGARPATISTQLLVENAQPIGLGALLALLLIALLYAVLQPATAFIPLSISGFVLPLLLIVLVTLVTTWLSARDIIRKPAIYALQGY